MTTMMEPCKSNQPHQPPHLQTRQKPQPRRRRQSRPMTTSLITFVATLLSLSSLSCSHNLAHYADAAITNPSASYIFSSAATPRLQLQPNSILNNVRGGDADSDGPLLITEEQKEEDHLNITNLNLRRLKHGAQTTGAGASYRNPSIFSRSISSGGGRTSARAESHYSKKLTASALAGEVFNDVRPTTTKSKSNKKTMSKSTGKKKNNNSNINDNPMLGRIWVQQRRQSQDNEKSGSSSSSLLFHFSDSAIRGEKKSDAVMVELSESSSSRIHAKLISSQSTSAAYSSPSSFLPIEGIYGVYNLPCSGPHVVLITQSEAVYTSPSTTQSSSEDGNDSDVPAALLELRRITSMEIVSLRNNNNGNSNNSNRSSNDDGTPNNTKIAAAQYNTHTTGAATTEQLAEEHRQLKLLRKSFKEHDLYFTVPRIRRQQHHLRQQHHGYGSAENASNGNEEGTMAAVVVNDVTHSLQRSFVNYHQRHQQKRKSDMEEGRGSQQADSAAQSKSSSSWWRPYIIASKRFGEQESPQEEDEGSHQSRSSVSSRMGGGVDARFFWNEQMALALLPPSASSAADQASASSALVPRPYEMLLDHVIPVTSAFVGVQRHVPIPTPTSASLSTATSTASTKSTTAESSKEENESNYYYDQLLISRRSKYRTGTRFTRRGVDGTGAVANYAETEQICFVVKDTSIGNKEEQQQSRKIIDNKDKNDIKKSNNKVNSSSSNRRGQQQQLQLQEVYSHVQTRGSIPLHWSSPANVHEYRPRVYIGVDPMVQARGLRDHLLGELAMYSSSSTPSSSVDDAVGLGKRKRNDDIENNNNNNKIAMVNLIDKHGDQGRLGLALDSVLNAVLEIYIDETLQGSKSRPTGNKRKNKKKSKGQHKKPVVDTKKKKKTAAASVEDGRNSQSTTLSSPSTRLPFHLGPDTVKHIWYDFHAECKGGRWDRLSQLLESVVPMLNGQGYFCCSVATAAAEVPTATHSDDCDDGEGDNNDSAKSTTQSSSLWEIKSLQDGVVRTNCMDCLDRTNVVQSMFGRYVLYRQLHERLGLTSSSSSSLQSTALSSNNSHQRKRSRRRTLPLECVIAHKQNPLTLPWPTGEVAHRHLWADNADAISRLYAGTPALKGDFTRTGQRTRRGALDDGLNSLQRYCINNFIDADRQEGMDLLVGSVDFTDGGYEGEYHDDDDRDESARVFMLQELEKSKQRIRRNSRIGFDETHARIKVNDDASSSSHKKRLTLNWLPGDLRHHMKREALCSRAPLSTAAAEEDLGADDAHRTKNTKSSDFLLRVMSSAAARDDDNDDDDKVMMTSLAKVDALETLHSIDRRSYSAKPWWQVHSSSSSSNNLNNESNVGEVGSSNSGLANKKRAVAASLMLLSKAPILSAALIAAIVATGFYSGLLPHIVNQKEEDIVVELP